MRILILKPTLRHLHCSLFKDDQDDPCAEFSVCRDPGHEQAAPEDDATPLVRALIDRDGNGMPDMIGLRVLFGGARFLTL